MKSIAVQEAFVAISAATAQGELTVTSNALLYPSALAWVSKDDGSESARVKILSVSGTTKVVVRRFKDDNEESPPSYGRTDMTGFAAGSHICMETQSASVNDAYEKRIVP